MKDSWDARIARADALAARDAAAGALLTFYAHLLRAQREVDRQLARLPVGAGAAGGLGIDRSDSPGGGRGPRAAADSRAGAALSGILDLDLPLVRPLLAPLLRTAIDHGPPPLADGARELGQAADEAIDEMLIEQWRAPSDARFFAKALLQPYAGRLAALRLTPRNRLGDPDDDPLGGSSNDRPGGHPDNRCPFCGGPPQLGILVSPNPQADGGGRSLVCATCLGVWPFRRILCAHCGEEDEKRLAYYHAPEYDHVRVDACDRCRHYLKSVDLTRLGLAVPLVDEVAAAALDVWARERGYAKIQLNLVGL